MMANTDYLKPIARSEVTVTEGVSWDMIGSISDKDEYGARTSDPLVAIHKMADLAGKKVTNMLIWSNFTNADIQNNTGIVGIEVKVYAKKYGRVVDKTVQLYKDSTLIGTNKALASIKNTITYGSSTDLWDTTGLVLTSAPFSLNGLSVAVQMASGEMPHNDSCIIDTVHMKVHYST
jgi:hypothetical protein